MADRVWGAGSGAGTDGLWSTAANWTGDTKPTTGDNVIFNNGVVLNCTIDEATAELGNFTIGGTVTGIYSGTITASFKPQMTGNFVIEAGSTAVFDLNADMDVDGDFTVDGAGTFDCGAGTITIAGNFDNKDQTTWTRGTSTIVLSGTTKTIISSNTKSLYNCTISGSYTIDATTVTYLGVVNILDVSGTLTCDDALVVGASDTVVSTRAIVCSGTIAGTSIVRALCCTISSTPIAWTAPTECEQACAFNATGTFAGTFLFQASSGTRTQSFGAGSRTFSAAVTFQDDAGILTIDNSANPSWVFQGGVTFTQTGTLTWTKGTGTITFSGSGDQTITTPAGWTQVLEDIVIDKGSDTAKVTLAGNVYIDTLTCTRGRLDLDGKTIDSAGSVSCQTTGGFQFHNGVDNDMDGGVIDIAAGTLTLAGTAGTQLQINDLDFVVAAGVTCAPTYCTVKDSTVTGAGGPINASASATNVNDGGNIGWKITDAYFIGTIDNVCVWSSPLTDAKSDWLYNAGSPRTLRDMQLSNDTNNPGTATLAALWKMNEASGTRNDSISTVHLSDVGTVASGTGKVSDYPVAAAGTVTGQAGVEDRARSSNGDGDANYLSAASAISVTDWPITISAWVKTTKTGAANQVVLSGYGLPGDYITLGLTGNTYVARASIADNSVAKTNSGPAAINDGLWHNILLVATSTTLRVYIDGIASASATSHTLLFPTMTSTGVLRWIAGTGSPHNGDLDSIAIFNADKSASAATIYNGGAGLDFSEHDALGNLVHFWSLSKNNPGGIGEDLKGTLDLTQTGTTVDAVGIPAGQNPIGTVYQWTDSGANADHITQATLSKRPIVQEILSGIYGVTGDGVDDYLQGAFDASHSQPVTVMAVVKLSGTGAKVISDGNDVTNRVGFQRDGSNNRGMYAGTLVTAGAQTTSVEIWAFKVNGASSAMYVNGGAAAGSGNAGAAAIDGLTLLADYAGSNALAGTILDYVVYDGWTLATVNAIGTYWDGVYGPTWTNIT